MKTIVKDMLNDMWQSSDEVYQDLVEEFNMAQMSPKKAFKHGYETGANIAVRKLWDSLPKTMRMYLNEKHNFTKIFEKNKGNLTETAKELKTTRAQAYQKAESFGLLEEDLSIPVPSVWGDSGAKD